MTQLQQRIGKFIETAKQAKAILRIPRLCSQYHDKIKGLSEQEGNQLLEKLYNDFYAGLRERREMERAALGITAAAAVVKDKPKPDNSLDRTGLSRVEESLIDRSINYDVNSKLSSEQNELSNTGTELRNSAM